MPFTEEHLRRLESVHKKCGPEIDWRRILEEPISSRAQHSREKTTRIQANWKNYSPGFFDQLFGLAKKKQRKLNAEYIEAKAEYEKDIAEHKLDQELAKRIVSQDPDAYLEAIKRKNPFGNLDDLSAEIRFSLEEGWYVEANILLKFDGIIPSVVYCRRPNGVFFQKKLSNERQNRLMHSYVAGCAFRIARELFALLGVPVVFSHVLTSSVDPTDGIQKIAPVLSVVFEISDFKKMNFQDVDCADALARFPHNCQFGPRRGFSPVPKRIPSLYEPRGMSEISRFSELWGKTVSTKEKFQIRYADQNGKVTEREVSVSSYQATLDGDWLVVGLCHLREEVRHFKLSRIIGIIDIDTGKVIDSPFQYVANRIRNQDGS